MTKFLKLSLNNFLSYKELNLDLDEIAYASVIGENGSGKSAIPQGIAWLIYGAARYGNSLDSIVNDSSKTASGILVLEDRDGQIWKIERSWTLGKSGGGTLELFQQDPNDPEEWVKFGDKLKDTAQKQINSIIGLTRDAFYSLVIMDQSKYPGGTAFTATDSNKRREILTSLVPELAIWKDLEIAARASTKEANREYDSLVNKIDQNSEQIKASKEREDSLKIILSELNPAEIEKDRKALEKQIATVNRSIGAAGTNEEGAIKAKIDKAEAEHRLEVHDLENRAKEIDGKLSVDDKNNERLKSLNSKKSDMEESLERISVDLKGFSEEVLELTDAVQESEEAIERIEPKIKVVEERIFDLKSQKKQIKERLELLNSHETDGECWVCGSDLPKEKHKSLVSGAIQELESLNTKIEDSEDEFEVVSERLRKAKNNLKDDKSDLDKALRDKDRADREIKDCESRLTEISEEIDELMSDILSKSEYDALTKELDEIDAQIESKKNEFDKVTIKVLREELDAVQNNSDVEGLKESLEMLETQLDDIQFRKTKVERTQSSLEEAQRNTSELNKTNKKLNRDLKDKRDEVNRLNKLVHATSPKGIPSILLDSILAAIEDEQNRILSSLSGGAAMSVEFAQERENKGEGSKEVLDIIVHTSDGNSRLYESFSFGERVKISISNLFAMIRVFNERSGGIVNTLFLDEPLGPLDKQKIPAFIDILRVAMNEGVVDSIFVITHDDRVIEALPQQISVSIDSETKISKVQVN